MGKWAAVIGSPIEHSLSPVLHRRAYELLELDWKYQRFEVDQVRLPDFMQELDDNCQGLSVTMPCKIDIAQHLDTTDSLARAVGAVNTVVCSGGLKSGFNTDVQGIVGALVLASNGSLQAVNNAAGLQAVILGTGATSASALTALAQMGVKDVFVVGRRFGVQTALGAAAGRLNLTYLPVNWNQPQLVSQEVSTANIVISTVPPTVTTEIGNLLSPSAQTIFLDVTYSKQERPLSAKFKKAGAILASPLAMLTYQGLAQVKLMTGYEVPFEPIYQAVLQGVG